MRNWIAASLGYKRVLVGYTYLGKGRLTRQLFKWVKR